MKLALHNYWRSSASHRVRIALGLKGLAYKYVVVNIVKDGQFADAYRAMNPSAQVPTLEITEDDGTVWSISQSLPIMEYLDERWPEPPILPIATPFTGNAASDRAIAFMRARSRALAEIVNSGIQPLQNLTTTRAVKKFGGDDAAWVKPFIISGLAAYERLAVDTAKQLGGGPGPFSVGDAPTLADCCLIPQLASARRFGVDFSQHALIAKIEAACMAIPAFVQAMPDQQPDAVK
ncbi:MAG: maleylacetoacetate isomerase [Deltaproteobacteria bacterium]|nr:maleylacetoacetate isomerase [Deltaproteobacteria bacterium]MDQ3296459.1 maleylacetoacetate isomerase [Myxococcota bacterium]